MNRSSQQYRSWSDSTGVHAGWTDSKLVTKPSTIWSKHNIYLHMIIWIVFVFCHMFQIKRLSSACSVLYLHRNSNTIVLMYVNLFFLHIIKASIIDSRKTIKYWHSAAHCYLDLTLNTLLKGNLDEKLNLSSQQRRALSDCTYMDAGLALC